MDTSDGRLAVARELAKMLPYNPFTNLYLRPTYSGEPAFSRGDGYVNLPHQVALYIRFMGMHPVRLFIADEIGLGKTVEALRFVKYAWSILGARRILVVVPPNLVDQWVNGDARKLSIDVKVLDPRVAEELELDPGSAWGVYVGSMDTIKLSRGRVNYFKAVSSVPWDVVIVDEAHKLGVTRSGRQTLRFKRIGELCRSATHCILLSATPTRGYGVDLLSRLSLLDPALSSSTRRAGELDSLDSRALKVLQDLREAYMVRRGKKHLRYIDDAYSKIPEASFHLFMVKPTPSEERLYDLVYRWTIRVLRELGAGPEVGLLRAILVKRALSSPLSLAKTLGRVLSRGGGRSGRARLEDAITALEDYMDGEGEPKSSMLEEADAYEDILLEAHLPVLSSESRARIGEMMALAEEIAGAGDSVLHMLAGMLAEGPPEPLRGEEPEGEAPNMLVFTEYKDTLYYIRSMLDRLLASHGMHAVSDGASGILSRLKVARGDEARRAAEHVRFYKSRRHSLLVLYLSSDNTWMIPLVKDVIDVTSDHPALRTVVISTDVAGEGLNLQGANVLVNYEVPWSMIKREQRIGRVWRIGQKRRVHVVDVIRATRLEEETYKKLLAKIYFLNLATGGRGSIAGRNIQMYKLAPEEGRGPTPLLVRPREASEYNLLQGLADTLEKAGDTGLGLEGLAARIRMHIERYQRMAEALAGASPEREAGQMLESIHILYGASTHREALDSVRELVGLLGKSGGSRLDYMLLDLEPLLRGDSSGLPASFISTMDSKYAAALLYTVEYKIPEGNRTVYVMPILVKIAPTSNGSYTAREVVTGLAAVGEAARILKQSSPISGFMIADLGGGGEIEEAALGEAEEAARRAYRPIKREADKVAMALASLERTGYRTQSYNSYKPVSSYIAGRPRLLAVFYNTSHGPQAEPGPEKRCLVQDAAEEYVKRLFEERGFTVEGPLDPCPSRGRTPYDLIARPRATLFGDEYYIEVKGHEGLVLSGELTERETEFARKNPDKYIICIVAMALSNNKKVFCNPYNKWNKRQKISTREVIYV